MTESEREKLVTDLANYVATMAPHQKERMGGKLILRAFEALKVLRVLDTPALTEVEHEHKLLQKAMINPAWEQAEWGIDFPDFTCYRFGPIPEHGPNTNGPDVGGTDPSN